MDRGSGRSLLLATHPVSGRAFLRFASAAFAVTTP